MKALKPTMREKKRYLLIEGNELKTNVEKAILDFIGVLGMSKTGLSWIKEKKRISPASVKSQPEEEKDSAIISVNREMVDSVRAGLCVWPKKMEVKRVSGTLKGLRR